MKPHLGLGLQRVFGYHRFVISDEMMESYFRTVMPAAVVAVVDRKGTYLEDGL